MRDISDRNLYKMGKVLLYHHLPMTNQKYSSAPALSNRYLLPHIARSTVIYSTVERDVTSTIGPVYVFLAHKA